MRGPQDNLHLETSYPAHQPLILAFQHVFGQKSVSCPQNVSSTPPSQLAGLKLFSQIDPKNRHRPIIPSLSGHRNEFLQRAARGAHHVDRGLAASHARARHLGGEVRLAADGPAGLPTSLRGGKSMGKTMGKAMGK